ncbi:MAG: nicotinate-nucleotide adenylyltransferase [Gammaproteobacteria bacterium]|nr:nicotinate-nucleotide adenylyltransferase [Gammaproteobacteria bacterium]
MSPIGIFGGTFDPVHYGHLRPALEMQQDLNLSEVRFIPCRIPPHKTKPKASVEHRLAMLQLALEGLEGMCVDQRELQREGISYMVDTLTSLRQELGERPICLILGMDAFAGIHRWHRWRDLLRLAHLVVASRPGSEVPLRGVPGDLLQHFSTRQPRRLLEKPSGVVLLHPVTQLDISATQTRKLAAKSGDLRFLMPEKVRNYIEQHRLYLS